MEWLNYHHLLYFWTVARHGSVSLAARELRLRQPTISAQLKSLEAALGHKLFRKQGRKLALTEQGTIAARYAEQIFGTGRELIAVMRDQPSDRRVRLSIGIADVVPKHVAHRLIAPIYKMKEQHLLVCQEDTPEELLGELALHRLDLVLSDSPVPPQINVRAYNHYLGSSPVALFAPRSSKHRRALRVKDLVNLPILMPTPDASLRRDLDRWFNQHEITPSILGEFEDSALMKIFGHAGHGLFPAPLVIAKELRTQLDVTPIFTFEGVNEDFYAISSARQVRHPSVLKILDHAPALFGSRQQT